VYGNSFDGRSYLNRFFNRYYVFSDPNVSKFCNFLFSKHDAVSINLACPPNTSPEIIFSTAAYAFNLSLRDVEQCFDVVRTVSSLWSSEVPILFPYMISMIILFHKGDHRAFEALSGSEKIDWNSLTKGGWNIDVKRKNRNGSNMLFDVQSNIEVTREYISVDLPKATGGDYPEDTYNAWVFEQMRSEMAKLHNNSYDPRNPPYSIAREYGDLVRGAGKLQPEQPT
jgi:hypothetical protein